MAQEITKGAITMGIMETIDALIREETAEKKSYKFVRNLILDFGFSNEQAAKAASVSVEFVENVRAKLAKKSN